MIASQSLFLTNLIRGRRFRSFFLAAAINRTPRTRCNLCLNSGVSSSDSAVLAAFSNVATSPSVFISWLASNCIVVPIVGSSKLRVCSACLQIFGSTRLTQISSVSSLLSDVVCVALVVVCVSFCAACVVFVISFCLGLATVFPDVLVSVNMIFGKIDFVVVSICFLADSTSLASRTGVVEEI